MKIESYSVSTGPTEGVCKRPAIWALKEGGNVLYPLMYLQKPKWMSDADFSEMVKGIRLEIPHDFEFDNLNGDEQEVDGA